MLSMSRPLRSQTTVFDAVADDTRREILLTLRNGEASVSELLQPLDMTMPALSRHLRVLREVGLVDQRRDGRRRLYRLNAAPLQEISVWLTYFEAFWDAKLDELGAFLDSTDE
jgi:DNA-binding transcriptional ArsR family regulator